MSTNNTNNMSAVLLGNPGGWGIQPSSTDQQVVKENNIVVGLDKARMRRQKAQDITDAFSNALINMQAQYVVCAEPAGYWDMYEGRLIKEQGFKLRHSTPKFKPQGGDKLKSIADIFRDHPDTTRCSYLTFRPGRPQVDGDHLNLWTQIQMKEVEGDITPFLEHMNYLCDEDPVAIEFILNWMALPLQKLGTKMESAVLLTGEQGTGKTIVGDILRKLHGLENTVKIKGEELESQFNDYLMKSTVVVVEEVCLKGKWTLMDRIKDMITSPKTRINLKHVSPYEIDNVTNFILFSNHSNAIVISDGDRRWLVVISHRPPKESAYYDRLYRWLEQEDGYEIIYHHLMHRDLSSFSRHSKPPVTQCKKDLAFSSKSLVEQKVFDDIDERTGIFASDLVTQDLVIEKYAKNDWKIDKAKESAAVHALHNMGANTGCRLRVKFKYSPTYPGGAEKIVNESWRMWSVRNHERWRGAPSDEMRAELKKAHPDLILKDD